MTCLKPRRPKACPSLLSNESGEQAQTDGECGITCALIAQELPNSSDCSHRHPQNQLLELFIPMWPTYDQIFGRLWTQIANFKPCIALCVRFVVARKSRCRIRLMSSAGWKRKPTRAFTPGTVENVSAMKRSLSLSGNIRCPVLALFDPAQPAR